MSGTQSVTVEHSQAVASHVPDRVRTNIEVDDAGPTGVPMIEPDHLHPTLDKSTNQRIRTQDTLSSRPHHHQDSGKPRIPDPLSPYPQRAGGHESLVRIQHGGTVTATCSAERRHRPQTTQAVLPKENGLVTGVELR